MIIDNGVLGDNLEDITEVPEHVEKLHMEVFVLKEVHARLQEEQLENFGGISSFKCHVRTLERRQRMSFDHKRIAEAVKVRLENCPDAKARRCDALCADCPVENPEAGFVAGKGSEQFIGLRAQISKALSRPDSV